MSLNAQKRTTLYVDEFCIKVTLECYCKRAAIDGNIPVDVI